MPFPLCILHFYAEWNALPHSGLRRREALEVLDSRAFQAVAIVIVEADPLCRLRKTVTGFPSRENSGWDEMVTKMVMITELMPLQGL